MEPTVFAKQVIDFQKMTIGNAFDTLFLLQDQAERMTDSIIGKSMKIPEEGQKMIPEWGKVFKKGGQEYRKTIDDGIDLMGSYFPEAGKTPKVTAK
jgi:hypothetical protein